MTLTNPYHTGSPLPPGSPVYVVRKSDDQAWNALQRMDCIMFLDPRQQGKTSLIYQLRHRCEAAGHTFVYTDLTPHREVSDESAWYGRLYDALQGQLGANEGSQPSSIPVSSATWTDFLHSSADMAARSKRRLVIAFDEIGAIPRDYATGFYAGIRAVYSVHRTHISVIFAGAVDPREMIDDPRISPFNIATRISLSDFNLEEVQCLVNHLGAAAANGEIAGRLHDWTGGQPYLCQRLCQYLSQVAGEVDMAAADAAVERLFSEDMSHIPGLLRSLEAKPDLVKYLCRALTEKPRFSPAINPIHFQLAHVIGIIAADQPVCQVRNPIYQRALGEAGLCSELPV